LHTILNDVKSNTIQTWDELHGHYEQNGKVYKDQKLQHAYASLLEVLKIESLDAALFKKLLFQALDTKEWMVKNIFDSRSKDYQNEFRKMVYDNEEEMENVIGKLDDNIFINQQREEFKQFRAMVEKVIGQFKL